MAKHKAARSPELDKENAVLAQQPVPVSTEEITPVPEIPRTFDQAILGMGQVYGNRYMSSLIENGRAIDRQMRGRIEAQRGSGAPLDEGLRAEMEQSFNSDLGDVKLHTGNEAADLAADLDAGAFTTGRDIFFADNAFQPGTPQGMRILKHELAHVMQQVEHSAEASLLTLAGDPVEADAGRAERSDSWSPAVNLPPGVIARNPPASPEAPTAAPTSSQASPAPGGDVPPAASDADSRRTAALRALWFASVITPLNSTQGLLMGGQIDASKATQAITLVQSAQSAASSVAASYQEQPELYNNILRYTNALGAVGASLFTYADVECPVSSILDNLETCLYGLDAVGQRL